MLRAQGCGGVELINPPCDMNEDDLILWAKTWSQQVKQWAVRFAEDSSATITQLAIKWGLLLSQFLCGYSYLYFRPTCYRCEE